MRKIFALALLVAGAGIAPVQAEPVPGHVLDRDYLSCMGGQNSKQDPVRSTYCNCVRDGMRGWSLEEYGEIAQQQQKAYSAEQVPAKIKDIAEACVKKMTK